MEDTILRGLTGVCPREPGGQGPGGAAGSLLHGPISHRGPHHPGGHGPEEEGREGSKTEPMPSRAPAAKASRMSPPGLRREVCREPRAASLASPCLLSFPTWSSSVPEPSAPGRPPKGIWSWLSPATEHVVLGGEERQEARVSDRKRPGLREYDRHATVSTSLNVQFDQSTDVHSRAIATLIRKRNTSRKLPHAALQPAPPHLQVMTDPPPGAAPSVCPTRKPLGQSPSPQVLSWVPSFGSVRRWRDRVSPCAPVLCSCYREPALDCWSIHGPMAAGRVPGPAAMNSRVRVFPWANLALASGHAVTAH
ncbi:uncharacterized protein LOC107503401 isoform X2 [Rousettus aegyptiacus]|uniref:uncharacterized protein LOC107503401 isoform X2 n=1 Tax=Rousettus aegyptiacus TaxID=9407 RepID=UPI00168D1E64|nr:uncharacterized protein LOC107503401 isoform X2 [Rousettus aegyptiacus]